VPAEQRTNVYDEPRSFTVGQISDLLSDLVKLDEDPSGVHLVDAARLAELLRTIGDTPPG